MINKTNPKIAWILPLASLLLLSGCLFHHHRSQDSDSDEDAAPAPTPHKTGSHHMPRDKASDLSDMLHHPTRHLGQYVSSYGPVRLINAQANGATEFQVTTPNYAYLFIVDFPGEVPNLEQNRDTYFLGTLRGVQPVGDAEALVVDGIAVQTTGGRGMNPYAWPKAIYVPGQERVTAAWLNGSLDLTESGAGGYASAPSMGAAPAPMAPRPAPAYANTYYAPAPAAPAAPAYQAPAPAYQGGAANSVESSSLIKVVQKWNELPPEARERILGIVSEYSR